MDSVEAIKRAVAQFDWSLYIECPHCKNDIDLCEYDREIGGDISRIVFSDEPEKLKGFEITCPECGKEFEIEGLEY